MGIFGPPRAPHYQYDSLSAHDGAFRLVKLLPPIHSLWGDTVRVEITTVGWSNECAYDTLSYAWDISAIESPRRRVLVETSHGRFELPVHRPLEVALLHIKPNRPIFVDQLCINQKDKDEQASQVQLMHDIYANCEEVLVWLGLGSRGSDAYFDFVESISHEGVLSRLMGPHKAHVGEVFSGVMDPSIPVQEALQEDRDLMLKLLNTRSKFPIDGMIDVLRRTWFSRLWVVQEVSLAPLVKFVCGNKTLCFNCFRGGSLYYTFYNTYWVHTVQHSVSKEELFKRNSIFDLNESIIRIFQERKRLHEERQRHSLYDLVLKYNVNGRKPKVKATLPDDRLFAVMGLASPDTITGFRIRYSETQDVFTEMAASHAAKNLDVLLFSQYPKLLDGLPSWVPDWSMDLEIPHGYRDLRGAIYNAGGPIQKEPSVDLSAREIVLHGVAVDEIDRVGEQSMSLALADKKEESIDYRSVKRFFDEIAELVALSRQRGDPMAVVRLSDFGLTNELLTPSKAEKMVKMKNYAFKLGELLIRSDQFVESYHISRILSTLETLPSYWVPAGEFQTLNSWALNPVLAFSASVKGCSMLLLDLVAMSFFSSLVIVTTKARELWQQSRWSGVNFRTSGKLALEKVGMDSTLLGDDEMALYWDNLVRNQGQRLYLTRNGYIGTGPDTMQQGDVVTILFGSTVPHILRPATVGKRMLWEYVGEAYADGLMHGEALAGDDFLDTAFTLI